MKLKDMIPELRYVVTKGGSTLQEGDTVWIAHDGSMMSPDGYGWLESDQWKRLRNEVEFNTAYYEKEIEKYQAKIKAYRGLIKKYSKKDKHGY